MASFFYLCEAANKFFNFMNKTLIEQLGFETASWIINNFRMKSTRNRYTTEGQSLGYVDWVNKEIGLPTKSMMISNRIHIIAHELAHGIVDRLEAKDPGITDRVWEKHKQHDTRFIHPETFTHVYKYSGRREIEQKEEALVEEITNRRYMDKPVLVLLKHFDELMENEPQLVDVIRLKGLPSHLSKELHSLYINYIDNVIYTMEHQGYTFGESIEELRKSPLGDYQGVDEEEDMKMIDYIEERARKKN